MAHRPYWRSSSHVWPKPTESGVYRVHDSYTRCFHAVLIERGWEGVCCRDTDSAHVDLRHWQALHEDLAAGMFTATPGPQATHRRAA